MMDTKKGGTLPADTSFKEDGKNPIQTTIYDVASIITPIDRDDHGSEKVSHCIHSITPRPHMPCFVSILPYLRWETPREEHTDEQPFCNHDQCLCHYDPQHMERHFIQPK
jgi:hypothetical protein